MTPVRRYTCHACNHSYVGIRHLGGTSSMFHSLAQLTMLRWQAICPRCSSTNLRRTTTRSVQGGAWVSLWRLLHLPAYRCNGCRGQFFALRAPAPNATEEASEQS